MTQIQSILPLLAVLAPHARPTERQRVLRLVLAAVVRDGIRAPPEAPRRLQHSQHVSVVSDGGGGGEASEADALLEQMRAAESTKELESGLELAALTALEESPGKPPDSQPPPGLHDETARQPAHHSKTNELPARRSAAELSGGVRSRPGGPRLDAS